jgi:hypothetical protein
MSRYNNNSLNDSRVYGGGAPAAYNEDEFRDISDLSTARVQYLRKQYPLIFIQQILAVVFIYEALSTTPGT